MNTISSTAWIVVCNDWRSLLSILLTGSIRLTCSLNWSLPRRIEYLGFLIHLQGIFERIDRPSRSTLNWGWGESGNSNLRKVRTTTDSNCWVVGVFSTEICHSRLILVPSWCDSSCNQRWFERRVFIRKNWWSRWW